MRVRVKLCGLTNSDAIDAAIAAGADAVGLVLSESPRRVSLSVAEALLARVPPGILRVAVFARPSRGELAAALALPFDALQAEHDVELPALPGHVHFLPVLRDSPELEAREFERAPARGADDWRGAVVLDGPLGGGRGLPADVERAARLARRARLVLAGGLTPDNVGERIARVRPFAVDASSGLERARGRKDPALITAFVRAVRAAETRCPSPTP
jgi:phosphoribosylanthranilate isomerase